MIPRVPERAQEISALLGLSVEQVRQASGRRLSVLPTLDELYDAFAGEMVEAIQTQNRRGEPTRFILPVGPVDQYSIFVEKVRKLQLDLSRCWFFFMDEYADAAGRPLDPGHPLSFSGVVLRKLTGALEGAGCSLPAQVIVPGNENIDDLAAMIDALGGIDVCFGGIGIHGHLAFNEPEAGVRGSDPRLVQLNDFTITINAIRAGIGGNVEGFPRQAFTLGMRQILEARKLRLACRNGIPLDWSNTVLRLSLLGTPGDDYPCTYVTQHPDVRIYTDADTVCSPGVVL